MTSPQRPTGHVLVPAAAIGGLSIILVAGLGLLGVTGQLDSGIARLVSQGGGEIFPKHLPESTVWAATGVFAFGLAAAILGTPDLWRRMVLWLTSLVLIAAWAPVLSLAAHAPDISTPWIAALWSGVCAVVYAANHRMPCDETSDSRP